MISDEKDALSAVMVTYGSYSNRTVSSARAIDGLKVYFGSMTKARLSLVVLVTAASMLPKAMVV